MCDFLFNLQSSWPFRSAEEGAVDALLCREELSVELVFVVLEDPLPLAAESAPYPPNGPIADVKSRHELPGLPRLAPRVGNWKGPGSHSLKRPLE